MHRALERAGNKLRGQAGRIRDSLRTTPSVLACAQLGPSLVAEAFSADELFGTVFDDVTARYAVWARDTATEANNVIGELLGEFRIHAPGVLSAAQDVHLTESVTYLRNQLDELVRVKMFDSAAIQTFELVPSGLTRAVLGVAGGSTDVTVSGHAWVALTTAGRPIPGLATGPDITGQVAEGGGAVEAYRWVYGPAQRGMPFLPHRRLDGVAFVNFDDPKLANSSGWPPYAYFMPGDHSGCRCDYEPIMLTPDQARAAGIAPKASPVSSLVTPTEESPLERVIPTEPEPAKRAATPEEMPSNAVTYSSPAVRKKFEPTMKRLDELHRITPGVLPETNIKAGGKSTRKGGHFTPATHGPKPRRVKGQTSAEWIARIDAWRKEPTRPEILMLDRGDGTQLMTLMHEFGHRIDVREYAGGFSRTSWFSERGDSPAMNRLIEAMRGTEQISGALQRFGDFGYTQYFRDPKEMWARAYSQWAANKLGGEHLDSLRAMQNKPERMRMQWTDEEFEQLSPLIEDVLRERGWID